MRSPNWNVSVMQLNQSFFKLDEFQGRDIPELLATSLDAIYQRFYRMADNRFDYAHLANSKEFNHYTTIARALNEFSPIALIDRPQQISFWLNVYNALLLHSVVMREVKESVNKTSGFYTDTHYKIGGHKYTLDDIEHGILRANAKKYMGLLAPIGRGDPRLPFVVHPVEPRIHFALYSASYSSPYLQVFRPATLHEQFDDGVQLVLARDMSFDLQTYQLTAPKMFYWYEKDFGSREDAIRFIARYLPDSQSRLFALEHAAHVQLNYSDFDWRLNQF